MPPYDETLELRLTIQYHGVKATQFFSKFTSESEEVMRNDLLELRLPLPKRSNMRLLSHGTAQVFWTGVPANNKILRQHLQFKLKGSRPPSEIYKAEFEQLSITNIVFKELVEPTGESSDDNMVKFVPARTVEGGASSSYVSSRPNKLKKYRDGEFSASGPSDSLENRISSSRTSDRDLYPDLTRSQVERIIEDGLHKTIHPSGPVPSTQLARSILFSIRNLRFVEGVSFFDSRQDLPPDEVDDLLAIMFYQRTSTGTPTAADSIFDAMMDRLCTNNDLCREKSLIYVNRALKKLISGAYKEELMPFFFSDPQYPDKALDLVVIDMLANYPAHMSEEMRYRFGRTRKLGSLSSAYGSSSSKFDRYDDRRHDRDWDSERPDSRDASTSPAKPSGPLKRSSTSPKLFRIELPKSSKAEPEKVIPKKRSPSPLVAPSAPRSHAPPTGPAAMRNANSQGAMNKSSVPSTPASLRATAEPLQDEVTKLREKIQQLEADVEREKKLQQDQEVEWKKKLDEQQKLSMELNDNLMAVSLEERTRMLEEETLLRTMLTAEQLRHEQAQKLMEEELLKERQRRILAEEALEDVRRECRAPFIVPALMEAFIHVSRTTTVLMQSIASSSASAPPRPVEGASGSQLQAKVLVPPAQQLAQGPNAGVKREWQ